jgi:hypothetical protein
MGPECGAVTPETLTDGMIREHMAWLLDGNYKLGEGPRTGLDKRAALGDCTAALSTKASKARARICAAINDRSRAAREGSSK